MRPGWGSLAVAAKPERIGIIFVHGIGEQRRFEHLETHLRPLINALVKRKGLQGTLSTIEITQANSAALHAEQETWAANPEAAIRAVVRENGHEQQLFFHEVWWADVNEQYSLAKQFRFWLWGLSLWATPALDETSLSGRGAMELPSFHHWRWRDKLSARLRLFTVSNVFAMAAFSLGAIVFLAKRLVGFNAPSPVRVFVNYISAVKLYSQSRRYDGGFLDAYDEPPRVSIRRRMIRTLVDVSCADYDRWYVLAHSLGSVVAFNGLMENAHALPNYLDEARWKKVKSHGSPKFAGAKRPGDFLKDTADMAPSRPLWLADNDVVYRDRLFAKFRGLLTYGSPLDKFAALWPAKVPINVREPAFEKAEWNNIYDATDPVAAHLDAYGNENESKTTFYPRNYGYRAYPVLLYSHLRYLFDSDGRTKLADVVVEWVLSGKKFSPPVDAPGSPWFKPGSITDIVRGSMAFATWIAVYLILLWLGVLTKPVWGKALDGIKAVLGQIDKLYATVTEAAVVTQFGRMLVDSLNATLNFVLQWGEYLFSTLPDRLFQFLVPILPPVFEAMTHTAMFKLAFAVAAITAVLGLFANKFWRGEDEKADELRKVKAIRASKAGQVVKAVKAVKAKN